MSESATDMHTKLRLLPMVPRDPKEHERAATPLELFFDLVFVVAVSIAGANLHHSLVEGHIAHGLLSYAMIFYCIYWAWMNFTTFAAGFDTDDWLYRTLTFIQMLGVVILAGGIHPAFTEGHFLWVAVGYSVMRIPMVFQWLRAARNGGAVAHTARITAIGIVVLQILWQLWASTAHGTTLDIFIFFVLAICELSLPVISQRIGSFGWHPHHMAERFGLFTIIVLGESLLASANAVVDAIEHGHDVWRFCTMAITSLVITAAMWWIYFWAPRHHLFRSTKSSVIFGYGHVVILAAAGAMSSGFEAAIDYISGNSHLTHFQTALTMTIPVALFIVALWATALRFFATKQLNIAIAISVIAIIASNWTPLPVYPVAFVLSLLIVALVCIPPVEDNHEVHEEMKL